MPKKDLIYSYCKVFIFENVKGLINHDKGNTWRVIQDVFEDLGYEGNTPNVWDGVPEEVLKRHNKEYDDEWLSKCVDQSRREVTAEWDDDMNLIT